MNSRAIYSTDPAAGWLPWGLLAPVLTVAFVAAPLLGVSAVLEHFQLLDANGDPIGLEGLVAFLVFPFALIGVVVLAWVRFVERRSLATIGLVGGGWAARFCRGHLVGLATSFAVVAAIRAAGGYNVDGYGKAFGSLHSMLSIAVLMGCFVLQASAEELLFRGWLLSATARKFNVLIAVVLTSITFALLHYGPQQHWLVTLNTFLFSVFACCWSLKAGNIWGVMGWHAGWNWLLATGFELPVTGFDAGLPALIARLVPTGPVPLTGGTQGPEGSVICGLFFAAASALLAWRAARDRREPAHAGPSTLAA